MRRSPLDRSREQWTERHLPSPAPLHLPSRQREITRMLAANKKAAATAPRPVPRDVNHFASQIGNDIRQATRELREWRGDAINRPTAQLTMQTQANVHSKPRFGVNERVAVNQGTLAPAVRGRERWSAGYVLAINHHDPSFQPGHTMPYQIRVRSCEDGADAIALHLPVDHDRLVRPLPAAPSAQTAASAASGALAVQRPRRMPLATYKALATAVTEQSERSAMRLCGDDGLSDDAPRAPALAEEAMGLLTRAYEGLPVEAVEAAKTGGMGQLAPLLSSALTRTPPKLGSEDSAGAALSALALIAISHALAQRRISSSPDPVKSNSFLSWKQQQDPFLEWEEEGVGTNDAPLVDILGLPHRRKTRHSTDGFISSSSREQEAEDAAAGRQLGDALRAERPRTVVGLDSYRRHLVGIQWDDAEIAKLARLMLGGDGDLLALLETLDVKSPNTIGSAGMQSLTRALLLGGAPSLHSLKVRADCAGDNDLMLLAGALNTRSGGGKSGGYLAAPKLWYVDVVGGPFATESAVALAATRRARLALQPPAQPKELEAAWAQLPPALARVRAVFDMDDAVHRQRRRLLFREWDGNGSGRLSRANLTSGMLRSLCGAYGHAGTGLYHRYYRSLAKAIEDVSESAGGESVLVDGFSPSHFRALLSAFARYTTWHEVFWRMDQGPGKGSDGDGPGSGQPRESDQKVSRAEWIEAIPMTRVAGTSWASSSILSAACESDFDAMGAGRCGSESHVTLRTFFDWASNKSRAKPQAPRASVSASARAAALPKSNNATAESLLVVRNGWLVGPDEVDERSETM